MTMNINNNQHALFTLYGWAVCLWVLIPAFQYGYHIAALNQIHAVLTCKVTNGLHALPTRLNDLPTCIPMSDAIFSFVTAIFTIGGLLGSLVAYLVMDRWGRKGASLASAICTASGAGLMAVSGSLTPLVCGRLLVGVAAGLGLCVVPLYISEIAPEKIRGRVGVLTQFSIVIGILDTQIAGLVWSTPKNWRLVLFLSCGLAIAQLLTGSLIVESPTWLKRHGLREAHKSSIRRLWRNGPGSRSQYPLLVDEVQDHPESRVANVTVLQLVMAPELQRPLLIVTFVMLSQQLSGINAVMYYSNEILDKVLPDWGPYVSLSIAIVNMLTTFVPIILIDCVGRKQLLRMSIMGILGSLLALGLGLDSGRVLLASVAIIVFVMAFAVGLGPVPFVMISEVSPPHAVSALSSFGPSVNWIANFVVGLVFLPLRNLLSGGDLMKEGRVFYVFALVLLVMSLLLSDVYTPP